tara:strand:+ start:190 stop:426 length:237 start_codon:yes stop_codon:yes gene_type:complete
MYGGGSKIKKALKSGTFSIGIISMLVFIYAGKALLVMYTYNSVAPRLISNWDRDTNNFRPLSYTEALMFTILANMLFT